MFNKYYKAYKKKKIWHTQRKKKYSNEPVPKKDLLADISDKDFKIEVLKVLKEIQEDL